jgi:hypothetical protein
MWRQLLKPRCDDDKAQAVNPDENSLVSNIYLLSVGALDPARDRGGPKEDGRRPSSHPPSLWTWLPIGHAGRRQGSGERFGPTLISTAWVALPKAFGRSKSTYVHIRLLDMRWTRTLRQVKKP